MSEKEKTPGNFGSILSSTYHQYVEGYSPEAVLKRLRQEKGMSLAQMEAITGFDPALISRLENGHRQYTMPTLFEIFNALDLNLENNPLPHAIILGFAEKYKEEKTTQKRREMYRQVARTRRKPTR